MKRSLLRVATLESGIITTTPATRAFFDANPTFHVNVVKDANGDLRAVFTSTTTGECLKTSPLTNDVAALRRQWQGRYVRLTTANSTINIWFDRTKCAEMEYHPSVLRGADKKYLCVGSRKGYDYKIVSYGTHPCAYISCEGKIKDLKSYDDFLIPVHGGATYLGDLGEPTKTYVGWDYAHGGDYLGDDVFYEDDEEMKEYIASKKKWTTEEILEEVYSAIDEIVDSDIKDIIAE